MAAYKQEDLNRVVGNIEQIAYARPVVFQDGLADGLKAFVASNGLLDFTVMASKCLDIGRLAYKGTNLSFFAKPGLVHDKNRDTTAGGLLMGGMCFTCGLDNVGPYHVDEGNERVFHGSLRALPAEQVSACAKWEDGKYTLRFKGSVRQASLFGENLVLHRTIETALYSNTLTITDVLENQGFKEEEYELLYHCNTGYPLTQPGSRMVAPSRSCVPRDEETVKAKRDTDWATMDAPVDNLPEQVYYHDLQADKTGGTFAAMVNDALGLAFVLRYQKEDLPFLTQWKSIASGDYVMGIEPGNCHVQGRAHERGLGSLRKIAPGQSVTVTLQMEVLEGKEAIGQLDEAAKK